jgi:hypothetical protein
MVGREREEEGERRGRQRGGREMEEEEAKRGRYRRGS